MRAEDIDPEKAYLMAQEIDSLKDLVIGVSIDYWTAFCLIGAIQTALCHPEADIDTEGGRRVLELANRLTLGFEIAPNCKSVIKQGWKTVKESKPHLAMYITNNETAH